MGCDDIDDIDDDILIKRRDYAAQYPIQCIRAPFQRMQWSLWPQNKCPFSNSALLIRQLNYNSFGLNGPVTTGVHLQTPSLNSAFPPTPSQSAHIHDRPEGLIYGIYNQVISFKEQTRSNIAVCSAFSRSSDLNGGEKKKRKGRSRGAAPVTTQPLGPFPGGPDVL